MSDRVKKTYKKTELTRERILETAERLFTERGLFETTMIDVAENIGIGRTSLYRYYPDKLSLSLAVFESVIGEIRRNSSFNPAADTKKSGLQLTEECLRDTWLNPAVSYCYRFIAEFDAFYSGSRIPRGFAAELERVLKANANTHLKECLEKGIGDGSVRSDLNAALVASTLSISLRNMIGQVIARKELLVQTTEENKDKLVDSLIKLLVDGISPRP